jgi:hypothetical protein
MTTRHPSVFGPIKPRKTPKQAPAQRNGKLPKALKTQEPEYGKSPYDLAAAKKLHNNQLAVLMELLHIHFKKQINPVPLLNKNLKRIGIDRSTKFHVLKALQDAGLITFIVEGQQTVMVTLLWLPLQPTSEWENASI